jgi:hypothetical protein
MDVGCITWLFVVCLKILAGTDNSTGEKNIRAVFFRIYRVVIRAGFIKNIDKLFK